MRLFGKKTETPREEYDRSRLTPVIRSSICTGEKTAGFRENDTGKFHEVVLVRNQEDLDAFKRRYGITEDMETIY